MKTYPQQDEYLPTTTKDHESSDEEDEGFYYIY